MSTSFDHARGLIIISARLWGPSGVTHARLALDTGATATLVRTNLLLSIGLDPALSPTRVHVTTGSRVESVPLVSVDRIETLGRMRDDLPIVAHTLPPGTGIDGLLGLDFLRGRRLTIDFRKGRITLN